MSEQEHESHGHSVAAWTAVAVLLVASLVMSLAVVFASVVWFVVGVVVGVIGVLVGKVLAMAGYGAPASTDAAAESQHRGTTAPRPGRSQIDSGTG